MYILRNRAANGMPLLTKMVPHFVPMLRKELCVRLQQKNVDGGIKLGHPKLGALYYLRWVHVGRRKPQTEFGRRLQAETIRHPNPNPSPSPNPHSLALTLTLTPGLNPYMLHYNPTE